MPAGAIDPAAAPPPPPAAGAGPHLELTTKSVDLGPIDKGQKAVARFELRNTGDEVLRILNARPG
ncbi:MAG TPA: DUF1573 domain-containing protein [Candidatus Polarisedimenticolaceae bacterium]|nr:DUF1573 domain-containing protein [Candidatus Polarisedimenticolaceae bacterium]